jgi:hypothetical protein
MWFSSSISYCIALAIEEGYTDVGLYGIDLESGEEYISQFTGCAHLMDVARDRGINIYLPQGCGLVRDLKPYPDRFETHLALTFEKKIKWLDHILSTNEPEYQRMSADYYRTEGALIILRRLAAGETLNAEEMVAQGDREMQQIGGRRTAVWDSIQQLKGEKGATEYYQRMFIWGTQDP